MMEQKSIVNKENHEERKTSFHKVWNYRTFLLLIIIGAMINNLDHSAELYMKISERVNTNQAYSVVIIFDLIVIALIGVGDSKALLFAISVFFINELAWDGVKVFYQIWMMTKDIKYTMSESTAQYLTLIEKAITMLIYGGTFAFTVHHFSVLFKRELNKKNKKDGLISRLRMLVADLKTQRAEEQLSLADLKKNNVDLELKLQEAEQSLSAQHQLNEKMNQQVINHQAELQELREFKTAKEAELTCVCGQRFEKLAEKYGHQRKCEVYRSMKLKS